MDHTRPGNVLAALRTFVPRPALGGQLATVLLFTGLLALLYASPASHLVRDWWKDPNYTHGFLVPLFSGYLVWRKREALRALVGPGSSWGLLALLAGVGLLVLGQIGAENFLTRSSLIVVIAGLVWFHLGTRVLSGVLSPLAFLFFMIPLPAVIFYALAFPLQSLAARNAAWVLESLGVPVLLDGNVIHLSDITLGVTEACSGIRSLISLLALASGWAFLTVSGVWATALFVAAAVPITIFANAARVVLTGVIGQTFGRAYAEGFFHTFSGWLIFVFAFVGLLGFHAVMRTVARVRRTAP